MLGKIRAYLSEPIIRLLFFLIIVLILVSGVIRFAQYYINEYYQKSALISIDNQNSKDKLSRIVIRDVLLIDSQYRAMLSSNNIKHIDNLFKTIMGLIEHCQLVIYTIKNGGIFKDVQLVNFYNIDQISENIKYNVPESETVQVDVINIGPRLAELKKLVKNSVALLKRKILSEQKSESDTFNLVLLTKQTDALLLRTREDANKMHYDIKQENNASQKLILKSNFIIKLIIIIANIIAAFFILGFAIKIAIRIYGILMSEKSAKREVLKANESMNTIIENIPIGVILINKNKEIVHINKQSAKILKYDSISDANIMIGKKCDSFFCQAKIGKCPVFDLNKEKILFREEIMTTKEGHKDITVLKSAIPITINNEDVIMEVFVDISARKQYQYELEQNKIKLEETVTERTSQLQGANFELEQTLLELKQSQSQVIMNEKLASVGQLASGIAHELNNPMQFIQSNFSSLKDNTNAFIELLGNYQQLAADLSKSEKFSKRIELIIKKEKELDIEFIIDDVDDLFKETAEGFFRTTEIITSMRNFSRTDQAGTVELYNLNDGIRNTLIIAKNEYKFICDIETNYGDIPKIKCIGSQINQVLLNMIINASHAIEEKKELERGKIIISTNTDNNYINCKITDNGSGIPKDICDKIFDPFYTSKAPGKGTGLGLSISHDIIVKKHGGKLEVESEIGHGTTFLISIPINNT